ncbi:hypothetical protein B0A48_07481 [Cryoendolithus antarcticus]|uniref:Trichodiene oxygenase n=1 Tax=Cryoendolithus antarcticus TaxID=1507870 RepID=A0A1V8T673_9PEZI|nr:hypothetical protein B0A48_07481 [Cryoendolithus antarcticus]
MFSTSTFTGVAVLALSSYAVYSLTKLFYRIFLHPIARFPGPRLAAATYLYEAYYDVWRDGQFLFHLDALHDQYGPVIRVSPDEIHVRDSEWFHTLYTGPGHVRNKWARSIRANGSPGAVASAPSHDHHRLRRSALNPYFSRKAIDELEYDIQQKVDKMCNRISREYASTGLQLKLGTAFTALTMDVITSYCFGKSQGCLDEADFAPNWKKLMTAAFNITPIAKHFPIVMRIRAAIPPWIIVRLVPYMSGFVEVRQDIQAQAAALIAENAGKLGTSTEDKGEKAKTVFHGILQAAIPDEEKTVQRMADEAFVLIIAGAETTAKVLTTTLTHVLQDPKLMHRLRAEISAVTTDGQPLSSRQLENIPLFKAVIQEGLRVAGPVTNRQMLMAPNEDLRYTSRDGSHDIVIPRGTAISMTIRSVLNDPAIFPHPDKFDPERWLRATEQGVRLDRYLVTFSKGLRACVGMNLSQCELYLGVAALITRFDMTLEDFDYERDLKIIKDHFVGAPSKEAKDVRVQLVDR